MACLFLLLENNEPHLHFYRMIPFEHKEDAEAHVNKLKEAFEVKIMHVHFTIIY